MNPWQLAQQIKHELATVTWEGGSVVFGPRSVFIYAGAVPQEEELPAAFPFATVTLGSATADDDAPDYLQQQVTVGICVEVAGDPMGEFALIGGARPDMTKSAGAGLGEVLERAQFAVQKLNLFDGASISVSTSGAGSIQTPTRGHHIAAEELNLDCQCTAQLYYAAPQIVKRIGNILSWYGQHCSNRFDFLQFVAGYVTGDTPVATPAELTATIFTGDKLETATTFAPNRVYQVFAQYDPRGTGSPASSSEALVGSYIRT